MTEVEALSNLGGFGECRLPPFPPDVLCVFCLFRPLATRAVPSPALPACLIQCFAHGCIHAYPAAFFAVGPGFGFWMAFKAGASAAARPRLLSPLLACRVRSPPASLRHKCRASLRRAQQAKQRLPLAFPCSALCLNLFGASCTAVAL